MEWCQRHEILQVAEKRIVDHTWPVVVRSPVDYTVGDGIRRKLAVGKKAGDTLYCRTNSTLQRDRGLVSAHPEGGAIGSESFSEQCQAGNPGIRPQDRLERRRSHVEGQNPQYGQTQFRTSGMSSRCSRT